MTVECSGAYPCVILQHKRRDVDLLGSDAGEELLQVVQVANLLLQARHAEGGEEPRRHLERDNKKGTFDELQKPFDLDSIRY